MQNALVGMAADALTSRVYELRGQERRGLVEMLHVLGEIDRRKVWAELAFSSLFAFLTDYLGYSKGAAWTRAR